MVGRIATGEIEEATPPPFAPPMNRLPLRSTDRPAWTGPSVSRPDESRRKADCVMCGFFLGIYLVYLLYPLVEEWRQRRLDEKRLRKMREDFAKRRRWDVAKGQWIDE